MDASRHGSFPRAHGFREGGPDASVRERVLRPLDSSRILPQRLTSPSPLPSPAGRERRLSDRRREEGKRGDGGGGPPRGRSAGGRWGGRWSPHPAEPPAGAP